MSRKLGHRLLKGHAGTVQDNGEALKTVINLEPQDLQKRLIVEDCKNLIIRGAWTKGWSSAGDVMKGKPYALDLRGDCENLTFEDAGVIGTPEDKTKAHWRNSASNSIIVRESCKNINFVSPSTSGVHYGLDLRGSGSVIGGAAGLLSADHLVIRNDDWTIKGFTFGQSLEVVSYDELHRDYIQMYKKLSSLRNILIQGNYFGNSFMLHKWEKAAQNILFSDGFGKNIKILDNQIITHHDIAILLNPCDGAEVRGNKIFTVGNCSARVEVLAERDGVYSRDVFVEDNPIVAIESCGAEDYPLLPVDLENTISLGVAHSVTDKYLAEKAESEKPAEVVNIIEKKNKAIDFNEFLSRLKNTQAPEITERDYQEAADSIGLSKTMVKAVFHVESGASGYNDDGSLKSLLERHWVYKLANRAGAEAFERIRASAGDRNCNKSAGGYQGGVAEYYRAATVCASGHPESLRIALESMSFGRPQIMGFNYEKAGYNSAQEMVEAMHADEEYHLKAFLSFIKAEGLVPCLIEADELLQKGKKPGKALAHFAEVYNGKKHKQYDLKIARAWHVMKAAGSDVVIKPKRKSDTLKGGAVATVGNVGAGLTTTIALVNEFSKVRKTAEETTATLQKEVDALKAQQAQPNVLLWFVLGFIILSQTGVLGTIAARIRDRWSGKNP